MCKCAFCGEWFEPTVLQIQHRLDAVNGKTNGELKLYCSEECKENCPVHNQKKYPKDQKPQVDRELQYELRQLVLERDNYTCQNCNTHISNLEVELRCHHKIPINEDPVGSLDKDNCITLCEECHKEIHRKPGCTYNELKCTY